MRIVGVRVLSGPNIYDDSSGVVIGTELGSLPPTGQPFAVRRDRGDRVLGALAIPGLADEWAATAVRGRAALPAFLLRLATALVAPASIFASGGQIIDQPGARVAVFIRCEHETVGIAAWDCACKAVMACLGGDDQAAAFAAALAAFRGAAHRFGADITTADVARGARRLDVPWCRLSIPGQFVQIGQGVHRRYLFDSTGDGTGAISRLISQDKQLTNRLLRAAGVPVLPMAEVTDEGAAIAAAERIGYPVVVKPCHGTRGRAVAVHLTSPQEVAAAFKAATAGPGSVPDSAIVEKFAAGDDYRVLVVDGRVVSVARRLPARVTGDGRHSVAALVEMLNQDPRRGHDHVSLLELVEIDAGVVALLAQQGLTPASVPESGRTVPLKRTANISTGGTAVDATDAIHPDNKAILERAATAMELAIAGVDFLSADITRPWREVGGVVLEINAFPGLRPHWLAHPGRSVIGPILRSLLPPGSDGRIPTCGITGSLGKTTTANMVARILVTMGLVVGRCTTAGVWVGEERLHAGDCAGGRYARDLLLDRRVQAGVFEIARGGLLNFGMTIEEVEVAAVLNIHDNHIGSDGIAGRADLARVKSIVARRARRGLVLNAEDPLCLAMRAMARADRLCLVGKDAAAPALRDHIAAGGCAVTLRGSPGEAMIVRADRGAVEDVIDPATIPATLGGRHAGKVWNSMFAVAIAQAMGASLDHICRGLRSFKPDLADSQGRFSIVERHAFRVVLDHAFSQPAIEELANAARQMVVAGRKWVYVMRTGQVSDELIRATGRALSGAFDRYVCTNSTLRPRPDPQIVPRLLRDGILAGGVAANAVTCVLDHEEAMRYILGEARPGDLVVINTNLPDKVMALLDGLDANRAERAAPGHASLLTG